MELITAKYANDSVTLAFHGRIDSSNASDADALVTELIKNFNGDNVVVDADDLEYISSAGLRVLLRLRKMKPKLRIENASTDVYEIFEVTGFSEMIPVSKGYRKVSIDGCEVIGQGANGKVYRIDPDTIIKVYLNPDSLPDIQRERELAKRAFVLGIPTAIPYDVVRVGESYGSVFELLNAKSFAKMIASDKSTTDECIDRSVELLKQIHSTEVRPEDMPDMREVCLDWVKFLKDYLAPEKWEKLYSLVEAVPIEHTMMHGDYHIKNVMLQNGESLLIDMDTLSQGNPIFEFASIFNAYVGFSALDETVSQTFLGIDHDTALYFWDQTLRRYFGTDDEQKLRDIEDKASLIGYTRLMRRLIRRKGLENDEGRKTVDFYKKQIESILERVNTIIL